MISQVNNSVLRTVMGSNLSESKEAKQVGVVANSKLSSSNKIEQLKESIDSGEYKVNLSALSQKMAQELL